LFKETPVKTKFRAENCKTYDIQYISKHDQRAIFLVKCDESYSYDGGHLVSILFDDYVPKKRDTLKPLTSEVKLKCECPAFLYWGSEYIATLNGYNLEFTQEIPPNVRDPQLQNVLCKHVVRVIRDLRGITFKQLKKKYAMQQNILPVVTLDEVYPVIVNYLERNRPDINPEEFLLSVNEYTFEEKMLEIGAIV